MFEQADMEVLRELGVGVVNVDDAIGEFKDGVLSKWIGSPSSER